MKPYIDKFQQLLNSIRADARLESQDKVQLLNMIEGYASAAALAARGQTRRALPPAFLEKDKKDSETS